MVKNNRALAQGYFIPSGTAVKNVERGRVPVYIERNMDNFGPFELAGSPINSKRKQIERGRLSTEIESKNDFDSLVRRRKSDGAALANETAIPRDKNAINSKKLPKNSTAVDLTQSERERSKLRASAQKTDLPKTAKTVKNTRGVNGIDKVRADMARREMASNKHVVDTSSLPNSTHTTQQDTSSKDNTNLQASGRPALDPSPPPSSRGTARLLQPSKGDTDLARPTETPPFLTKKSSLHPVVTSAFCDRCSITFDIPNPDLEGLIFKAKDLAAIKSNDYTLRKVPPGGKQFYDFNLKLVGPARNQVALIQFNPKNKKASFCRIEFNPREIGAEGIEQIKLILKGLLGQGYRECMADGNFTRLDATFDIDKLRPDDVMIVSNRARNSSLWKRSFNLKGQETWATETHCLGSSESDYFATVYDKGAQLWRVKGECLNQLRTRVEVRINPRGKGGRAILVKDILQIKNPFAPISLAYYPSPDGDDPWFEFFVCASRHFGQEEALRKIKDRSKRAVYRRKLLENEPDWWQPDKLWADFLRDLKATGLFPDKIFQSPKKAAP